MKTPDFYEIEELRALENLGWFCSAIVFDPSEEMRFSCPHPYLIMSSPDNSEDMYIIIPQTVAYYAATHAGFTNKAREARRIREIKQHISKFLNP